MASIVSIVSVVVTTAEHLARVLVGARPRVLLAALATRRQSLARAGQVALLGVVVLGLSASVPTPAPAQTMVNAAIAMPLPPTGCVVGPALAQMLTVQQISAPFEVGLRRDANGNITSCAQPGLAVPAPAGGTPHLAGQVILVDLAHEWLYAYQDGHLVLASPVSSGRPDLRTPVGTFTIQQKISDTMFTSPWPVGSPFYYAPLHVNYGLLFLVGGFYIHDAPWRTTYGLGSENPHLTPSGTTETGSHGCIEMPTAATAKLYAWANLGATVIIRG